MFAWNKWMLGGIAVALVALVVLAVVFLGGDDDVSPGLASGSGVTTTIETQGSTTSQTPPVTATTHPTSAPVPVSTTTPVTVPPSAITASEVVWPRPGHETRFDDPVVAARSFAIYYAGFSDPVVGSFVVGDSRSGEVAVRSHHQNPGAVTTVLVRRMEDDHWYVIGATTPHIELDLPGTAGKGGIRCPGTVRITGSVLSFEGHVDLRIDSFGPDGYRTEIGRGFGTGSGVPPAAPFKADVTCDAAIIDGPTPDAGGVIMAWDDGAFDGERRAVAVRPVSFAR